MDPEGHGQGGGRAWLGWVASSPRASLPGQESQELCPRDTGQSSSRAGPHVPTAPQQVSRGNSGGHRWTLPGGPRQTGAPLCMDQAGQGPAVLLQRERLAAWAG